MAKLYIHDDASQFINNISKALENIKQAVEDFYKWESDETRRNKSRNEFLNAFSDYKNSIDGLEGFVREELKQIKKNPNRMQGLGEEDKFSTKKFKSFYSEIVSRNRSVLNNIEKGSTAYRALRAIRAIDEKSDIKIRQARKYMRAIDGIIRKLEGLQ